MLKDVERQREREEKTIERNVNLTRNTFLK